MVIELAQTTWDNIVKILTGSKVEPEGKPEVKPEDKSKNNNNQSKSLTDADIKQKVANLQPRGRHFKHEVEHSGINGNSSELVTWKRNKDKTLLKTTSGINSVYSVKCIL